jgi:hypothetical protein
MAHVETEGCGKRLVESIKGVLVGVLFFLVSFPLLWWNEGRAVQTTKSLMEGAAIVVSVSKVDPVNEGKLVHVTGQARTDEWLADPELGVNVAGLKLARRVEVYQWFEKSESKENAGGSKTTITTYDKKWSDTLISSSAFKEPGHTNPSEMRLRPFDVAAKKAKLGEFDLSSAIVAERLDKWETLPAALTADVVAAKLPGDLRGKLKPKADALFIGDDASKPAVGDIRLTYQLVSSPLTMTLVARQTGTGFSRYPAPAGDELLLTAMEAKDAPSMFQGAEAQNTTLTWILRGVGWFMMTLGLFLVLRPIAMLVSFVPFAGSFVRIGALVLAASVSTVLSLLTIAAAWIAYRPFLGGLILLGGVVAGFLTITMMRRARARKLAAFTAPA